MEDDNHNADKIINDNNNDAIDESIRVTSNNKNYWNDSRIKSLSSASLSSTKVTSASSSPINEVEIKRKNMNKIE